MSGWMAACKDHMKKMIEDIEESIYFFNGMCETDDNLNCDFPECTTKAHYEIYWGDECLIKKSLDSTVRIGSIMDDGFILDEEVW